MNSSETVEYIPLEKLKPFPNHPFRVRDDAPMRQLIESIRQVGVLVIPILLACFFRMWQNALIFAAVGAAGYLVLALVVSIEVLLETARASVIGMMKC